MPHVMMPHERAAEHQSARHHNITGEKFIQAVVSSPKFRKGALTKKAKAHGEKPLEFAHEVLEHPEKHDIRTRRQAQFLENIQRKR
jgi:hypothetical protein